VRDSVAPTIRDVSILPLDAQAHVEGGLGAHVLRVGDKRLLDEPVRAAGRLGFAVRALDRAAPGPYRQAPYTYEVRVDGRRLYRAVHERFDYAHNHQIILDYDQERLVDRNARFFNLFARPGNLLAGREPRRGGRGVLSAGVREAMGHESVFVVPPGRHEVEIEVTDVAGHRRRVRFPLLVSNMPRIDTLRAQAQGESLQVECSASDEDRHELTLRLEGSRDAGASWEAWPAWRDSTRGVWRARIAWDGSTSVAVRARVSDPVGLEAMRTAVAWAPEAIGGEVPVRLEKRWRYGRLELEVETDDILMAPPGIWIQRPDGRRAKLEGVRQVALRRWSWAAAAGDLDDLDAIVIEVTALDGRRAIHQEELRARIVRAGVARVVDDLDPHLRLEFDRETLFEDIAVRMEASDPRALDLGPELDPVGLCVRVEPLTAALNRRVRVSVDPGVSKTEAQDGDGGASERGSSRVALYEKTRQSLRFRTADPDASGRLVTETRFTGVFVLLRDETAPELRAFRAQPRSNRPPRLQFVVEDLGADIADGDIVVEIDGERAIPEWDPETGRVRVHPIAQLDSGPHQLEVRVADRVGNRSTRTWGFQVP
jgi:hypothetical protein